MDGSGTESIMDETEELLGEQKYPVTSEELAAEYANEPLDLPNETESLGSVFDRLTDERFETPVDDRETVYGELTGAAGGRSEAYKERELGHIDDGAEDGPTKSGSSDM